MGTLFRKDCDGDLRIFSRGKADEGAVVGTQTAGFRRTGFCRNRHRCAAHSFSCGTQFAGDNLLHALNQRISHSLRTAGNVLDESIVQYMKREHKILIGDGTAEALKKDIGSVHPSMDRGEREIRGRNLRTGLPAVMTVTSAQVREAMREGVDQIIDTIRMALESTPPELSADIFDFGIMLAGGGALLGGLPALITERTGVRVTVAKRPLDSVALGIGRVIEGNYSGVAKYRAR